MSDPSLRSKVLISARELGSLVAAEPSIVPLDIRLDEGRGRTTYQNGHIAGAVHVDPESDLVGRVTVSSGRRPLPDILDLQNTVRRWGVNQHSKVVVYDEGDGSLAARAWWILSWAGVAWVRLLDGGLNAWRKEGLPLHGDEPALRSFGNVELTGGKLPVLDADGAAALARSSILLDARGATAYAGQAGEPGQERSGHIPGARSAPTRQNLTKSGTFLPPDQLRARFASIGVDGSRAVGVYCGSGGAASHEIVALASLGIEAALYPGSWSAWISDPNRPVATGDEPG